MDNAFDYIKDNNGIDTEASYPYYARQLPYCYFKRSTVGATDTGTEMRSENLPATSCL